MSSPDRATTDSIRGVRFREVFHRNGQTFLTWEEDQTTTGESYRIYRSSSIITSTTLGALVPIQTVREGSSIAVDERLRKPPNFRNWPIHDLGEGAAPLDDSTGLFVWTPGGNAAVWYGITRIFDGIEDRSPGPGSVVGPILETDVRPRPVLVYVSPQGFARVYVQYMDLRDWNPTLVGYAFSYSIQVPPDYDGSESLPLGLFLHGWTDGGHGTYWIDAKYVNPAILIAPSDPQNTWWYGWSASHDYSTGLPPSSGPIVNYTEMRMLRMIYDAIDDPNYRVDQNRIYAWGHSMGGTGVLSLGIRYPDIFTAVYSHEAITNFRTQDIPGSICPNPRQFSTIDGVRLWGRPEDNLPIENHFPDLGTGGGIRGDRSSTSLTEFDGIGVWDWWDRPYWLTTLSRGRDTAFLGLVHGNRDCTISWETQGRPIYQALETARVGWSGITVDADHTWVGFVGVSPAMGPGYQSPGGDPTCLSLWEACFQYPRNKSYPAFSNNSGNAAFPPSDSGACRYNLNVTWALPWFHEPYHGDILDTEKMWAITLFSASPDGGATTAADFTMDVTPRRTQAFHPKPGEWIHWVVRDRVTGDLLKGGETITDDNGLTTVQGVPVRIGGVRLELIISPGKGWILR